MIKVKSEMEWLYRIYKIEIKTFKREYLENFLAGIKN